MNKIIVLTPFSRPQNVPALVKMLEPQEVEWHPICHDPIHVGMLNALGKSWVVPKYWPAFEPKKGEPDVCYCKLNWYLERRYENNYRMINEDAHYHVLCDDDGVEPEFYDKVRKSAADVVFVSVDCGDVTTTGENGFSHRAGIMRCEYGKVGRCQNPLESYLVRGKVLRDVRWHEYDPAADGQMGAQLYHMRQHGFGYSVEFMPDAMAMLNALQPGRFNTKRW